MIEHNMWPFPNDEASITVAQGEILASSLIVIDSTEKLVMVNPERQKDFLERYA